MIDTIKIKIDTTELEEDYQYTLEQKLGIPEYTFKKNGTKVFRWEVDNMMIRLDNMGLLVQGSLTKYSVGDNLKSADKDQLMSAVERLGVLLGIDLYKGIVKGVDIAANIRTVYPVKEYYPFLVDLSRLNRNELHNGLSFSNTLRYVSFYGKIKEMKRKRGVEVDEAFVNENILRFEYKHTPKSLIGMLKVKEPTVQYLFERYNDIVLFWKDAFESVEKMNDVCEPTFEMFSVKGGFDTFLMMKGIEAIGGLRKALNMVDVAKGRKYLCRYPNQSTNIKKRLKKIMASTQYVRNSKLVEELEEKIAMIYQHALARC